MLSLLLLTLLIVDTTKSSELKPHMPEPTAKAPKSPQKVTPAETHFGSAVTTPTITGALSALEQYFETKRENRVLTLAYKIEPGQNTFKPQISSINQKYLYGVTTVIIRLGILSPHHQKDIFDQLQQQKIKIITRC